MEDWESIIIYGFAGWMVITDFYLIMGGIYQIRTTGEVGPIYGPNWMFFVRKMISIATGFLLIVVYRERLLSFEWSLILWAVVSLPDTLFTAWRYHKIKPTSDVGESASGDST